MSSNFIAITCLIILFVFTLVVTFIIIKNHKNNTVSSSNNLNSNGSYPRNNIAQTNSACTNSSQTTCTICPSPITETEVMDYFANTRHNQKDNWFRFRYKRVNSEWRAYIVRMPSLNGRSPNLHLTHRYTDSNGNYWVCRSPQPTTLKDCQAISKVWADRLLEYIATGVEANSQQW